MSNQFTPGPWAVIQRKPVGGLSSPMPEIRASDVSVADIRWNGHNDTHGQANARLIAAAPALYEALRTLRDAAKSADNLQHAGIAINSEIWSRIYNDCNDATAALALVDAVSPKGESKACCRCASLLDARGLCGDETCPFSDYQQADPRGMTGHPEVAR